MEISTNGDVLCVKNMLAVRQIYEDTFSLILKESLTHAICVEKLAGLVMVCISIYTNIYVNHMFCYRTSNGLHKHKSVYHRRSN